MKFLRDATPFTQVLFTLILVLTGGILLSVIGFLVCWLWMGISMDALSGILANFNEPGGVSVLKFFQVLQSLGMFILPPLILAKALDDNPIRFLQLQRRPTIQMVGIVCAIILVSGPMIEWFSLVNQHLSLPAWMNEVELWMRKSEDQANEITKAFLATKSWDGVMVNLFIVAVLPAIGEELLFRGVLQKMIKMMTKNSHAAIWITATLFSALHLQFFGFLPRLLLGVLFGYLLEWTGTLWLPIMAHFINNAAGVLIFFFTGEGVEPDQPDAPIFNNSLFLWAILSGIILAYLLRYLYLRRQDNNSEDPSNFEVFVP